MITIIENELRLSSEVLLYIEDEELEQLRIICKNVKERRRKEKDEDQGCVCRE